MPTYHNIIRDYEVGQTLYLRNSQHEVIECPACGLNAIKGDMEGDYIHRIAEHGTHTSTKLKAKCRFREETFTDYDEADKWIEERFMTIGYPLPLIINNVGREVGTVQHYTDEYMRLILIEVRVSIPSIISQQELNTTA